MHLQETSVTAKEALHRLVDELPEDKAERLLRALRTTDPVLRARWLADVSRRVRAESMRVNAEFAIAERDPDAQ
jgi:hypothetical protein